MSGAASGRGRGVGAVPPLADLALGAGDFPAVVVGAEVVAGVALLDAVLAGAVAGQRPGEGDPVLAPGPLHVHQGGVAAVHQVLAGSRPRRSSREWIPARACLSSLAAGMVATSVMTLGPSSAQVSVTWARYPVQRVTWPRREWRAARSSGDPIRAADGGRPASPSSSRQRRRPAQSQW